MPPLAPNTCRWTHRLLWVALALVSSGCDRLWSPAPPPPSQEEVVEMRRVRAAQQAQQAQLRPPSERLAATPEPKARPTPLQNFSDWSMQDTVADALGRIGPAAVPELVGALRSTDTELRWRATQILGRIGPEAVQAVPDLVALLNDPDPRVSRAAARTLGQIGPNAASAIPALIQRLDGSPRPE